MKNDDAHLAAIVREEVERVLDRFAPSKASYYRTLMVRHPWAFDPQVALDRNGKLTDSSPEAMRRRGWHIEPTAWFGVHILCTGCGVAARHQLTWQRLDDGEVVACGRCGPLADVPQLIRAAIRRGPSKRQQHRALWRGRGYGLPTIRAKPSTGV